MMDFLLDNVLLVALITVSGLMLIWPMFNRGSSGVANVSPSQAVLLMNRNKIQVLDVRTEEEYRQGHIKDAKNIPVADLANQIKSLEKYKEKPILVYCGQGMRSKTACTILKTQGFNQLHHLLGGINAWIDAKMPINKH